MKKMLFLLALVVAMLAMVAGCAPGTVAEVNTPTSNTKAGTPTSSGEINVPGVSIQVYTPGPNPMADTADANGHIASIGLGIWHGIISPVTMVLSFVNQGGQMYEVHNDGSQYNLGFLVGVAIVFILLSVTVGSRRR
ncbi:MAG: hypothetical protein P1P76_07790 [Anaerolineales bacterium]|nr:hypothetical protein [Anaerolineales bacterium]